MPETKIRDDPVLEKQLTASGCPYPQGSAGSVVYLQGYRAGLLRALAEVCAALGRSVDAELAEETLQ